MKVKGISQQENRYAWLARATMDLYCASDLEGTIREANDTAKEAFGEKLGQDILGSSMADFFASDDEWRHFKEVLLGQGEISGKPMKLRREGGIEEETLVSAVVLVSHGGQPCGFQFLIRTFTPSPKFQEKLTSMEKLASLGQLSASVAHEINNPLNIILGYTQLLLREAEPGTDTWESLKEIEGCAQTCRRVVGNLLNFARKSGDEKESLDPNQVLSELLDLMEHQFRTERITLVKNLREGIPLVYGNAGRLKEAFMNLLINARQAIGSDGTVSVTTSYDHTKNTVVISFQDTGCGMSQEVKKHIFEPFFTTKEEGEGTGLGLTVTREIIAEHGGKIQAESEPGKGSTISVFLPAQKQKPA